MPRTTPGYDVVGPDGTRYQIKYAFLSQDRASTKYAFSNIKESGFDYLICLCWEENIRDFDLRRAKCYQIPRHIVLGKGTQNGLLFIRGTGYGFEEYAIKNPWIQKQPTFATDTATKLNISPRTVQQDVQIAEKIAPDVKEIIAKLFFSGIFISIF